MPSDSEPRTAPAGPFRTRHRIRFEHCDAAGILFFPWYAWFVNRTVEDWFEHGLGCDFTALHGERGLAIPTAHLELAMLAPCRLGETVDWTLTVGEVRSAAVVLHHVASAGGTERLRAVQRLVFAQREGIAKTPIPADLRPRIESFRSAAGGS